MLLASLSSSLTTFIGDHGLYAVFVLMLVDSVLPAASELVMLYAGVLASGALAGQHVVLFGHRIDSHFWGYVAMSRPRVSRARPSARSSAGRSASTAGGRSSNDTVAGSTSGRTTSTARNAGSTAGATGRSSSGA